MYVTTTFGLGCVGAAADSKFAQQPTVGRLSYSRSRDGRALEILTRDHKKTRFLGFSLTTARKISVMVARPIIQVLH